MSAYIINKTIRVTCVFNRPSHDTTGSIGFEMFYPVGNPSPIEAGVLEEGERKEIRYKGDDGFIINGWIFSASNKSEMVLLGDLFYGTDSNPALQNHFDGTIMVFPLSHRVPITPIDPVDIPDNNNDFPGELSMGAPLFPYIYVQPWPKETAIDDTKDFFFYDTISSPTGSLYNQLADLYKNKDRAGMEALVIKFLQNDPVFKDQYFERLSKVPEPFNLYPKFYDRLAKEEPWDHEKYMLPLQQPDYATVKEQVWENYFALLIMTGFNEQLFIDLNKILLFCHLIENYKDEKDLPRLLKASTILPATVFPLPPYSSTTPVTTNSWVEPYAIGELKMAKYRLLRYEAGEIARIQNVLKGEKKKTIHRTTTSTVEQSAEQNSNTHDHGNDSQETTNELLVETHKTVAELTRELTYEKLKTTYGPPTQAVLDGKLTKKLTAGKPSDENTNHFANRVVNKTLNRINEAVVKTRAYSNSRENEEISYSLFDNQAGTGHFRGIFRWLNKIYRISVENYGYRFLLELNLDKPAVKFIADQQALNNINLQRPLSPAQKNISGFNDITVANYMELVSYYQLTNLHIPPEALLSASTTLNAGETQKYISIPDGYTASNAIVAGQIAKDATLTAITGILSTVSFSVDNTNNSVGLILNHETDQVAVAVVGTNIPVNPPVQTNEFILNATVYCAVTDKKVNEWKIGLYREITEAYERMMAAYTDQVTRFAPANRENNPLLLHNIEQAALQAGCIDLLLEIAATKNGYPPAVQPSLQNVNRQQYLQFFEEAFEWNEMTYQFNDQPSVLSYALQGRDDSLRPFLQAGAATIFLPVRPEYNFEALYYLSSGIICPSPYPFVPVNDIDTPIAIHLKKIIHCHEHRRLEKYWDITLPTSMQVIDDDSQLPIFVDKSIQSL